RSSRSRVPYRHADLPSYADRPARGPQRQLLHRNALARPSRVRLPHARRSKRDCDGVGRSRLNRARKTTAQTHPAAPQIVLRNPVQQAQMGRNVGTFVGSSEVSGARQPSRTLSITHASTSPRSKSLLVSRFRITRACFPSTKISTGRQRAL